MEREKDRQKMNPRKSRESTAPIKTSQHKLNGRGFDFGPLLIGKTKDLMDPTKNPEHFERIKITNVGPMDLEVEFTLQKDVNCLNFMLHPTSLSVRRGEVSQASRYPRESSLSHGGLRRKS